MFSLLLVSTALSVPAETQRPASPFAPSLPKLTEEEENYLDLIIDRFIQYDIGELKGEEGKKALQEFQKLGPDATFALIRGLNRAAQIEGSCPVVVIGKKLMNVLNGSTDLDLLEFARENIGADVGQSRHLTFLKDLRVAILFRKSAVIQAKTPTRPGAGPKTLRTMTVNELVTAASNERGDRLRELYNELELRKGDDVIKALGLAASISYDEESQRAARAALQRNLGRQGTAIIKEKLKDDRPEVRAAAARAAGNLNLRHGAELIDLLEDREADVRAAAHLALVRLNRGTDFGPADDTDRVQRDDAISRWRTWWAKQK